MCIYTPNIGVYQGHGSLLPAAEVSGCSDIRTGAVARVTLFQYELNGF